MAILTETYTLESDDESESLRIEKDFLGNIALRLQNGDGTHSILISEEFTSQFTYALNRLT